MSEIDLEIDGISKSDLMRACEELGIPVASLGLEERKHASGATLLDLAVQLSHIDINLLSALIGYLLGKGVSVYEMVSGNRTPLSDLREVKERLAKLEQGRN